MVLTLNTAANYKYRTGTETVRLTRVRNVGDMSCTITNAKRRPVGFRQQAESMGVYTARDVNWWLPKAKTLGDAPKPGDKITDSDRIVWTVLESPLFCQRADYKCVSRALAIEHKLCDRCDVFRPAPSQGQDIAGNREPSFYPYKTNIACAFQEASRQVVEKFGKLVTEISYDVTLEEDFDLTNQDQVRAFGRTYDVTGYRNATSITELAVAQVVWRF